MHKREIIATLKQHETELRSLGVQSLAIFGSVVRQEPHAGSDLDVLYEFKEGEATLEHYLDLQSLLETLSGRNVDLVPHKYLHPLLRKSIGSDIEIVLQATA